jgi:sporulation protein YlmC with PRC-barrel domain
METMTPIRTLSMSTLMNEPVHNMQGERIGKVEDYMIDLQRGCVEYAVLSFGGFLGIGEKLFAIPWESMQLDTDNHVWRLDVTRERLQQAPGFNRDNWPDLGSADYRRSLSTFWAVNASGNRGETQYQGVKDTERSAGMREADTETRQMYGRRRDDMPYEQKSSASGYAPGETGGYGSGQESTVVRQDRTYGEDRPFGETEGQPYGTTEDRPYGRRRDDY